MSILSWFMSTPKAVEKTLDMADRGLDAVFFTEEEKSQASQKVLDWKLKYLELTANQSPARRFIAVLVSSLWTIVVLVGMGAKYFDNTEFSEYCFKTLKEVINEPFMVILAFYFLAHIAGKLKR